MLVGYLGPQGSFLPHDVASFPTSERIAYRTITDVIKAYENQSRFCVCPQLKTLMRGRSMRP